MTQNDTTQDDITQDFDWQEIPAPKTWAPEEEGSRLVGFFGGTRQLMGKFGHYLVVMVHTLDGEIFSVSGRNLVQQIELGYVPQGHPIQITWQGYLELANGNKMKQFKVLIANPKSLS